MRHFILIFTILFAISSASAGLLDDLVDQAKQATDKVVNDTLDKVIDDNSENQKQPSQSQEPANKTEGYDPGLVKEIQQALNDRGYNSGKPDGIYGSGTRMAIESFQNDQGIPIDGIPTTELLSRIQQLHKSTSSQTSADNSVLPEPTLASMTLAAIHFRPDILDTEYVLTDVLLQIHPELQPVVSNEFQWHKKRDELKQQLLDEAAQAPLEFEARPWNESSVSKDRPFELKKYDFKKSAFLVQFASGTAKQLLPSMLVPGTGRFSGYEEPINWLSIDADRAEQVANYFGTKKRILWPSYRIRVVDTNISSGKPVPILEFIEDRIDLYAREVTHMGNSNKVDFKPMVSVSVPTIDQIGDDQTIGKAPATKTTPVDGTNGTVTTAVVDGVKLGMTLEKALKNLASHGLQMNVSSANLASTKGVIKGRGQTEDGKGWINVNLYHKDGVVYRYDRAVGYLTTRLPLPDGTTLQALEKRYWDQYTAIFSAAPHQYTASNGKRHFDDESRTAYTVKTRSPHASIIVSDGGHSGRFLANLSMEWKQIANVEW